MADFSSVASQIIAALAISDPDLDTSIGTTARKMIDAFAESVAEGYVDQHMLSYVYDVDAKIGADLDAFVENFGMKRYAATRATGVVTFVRSTPAAARLLAIPISTQLGTTSSPQIVVVTTTAAILGIGVTSIVVPVQAVVAGTVGNAPANSITAILSTLSQSLPSVINLSALSNGRDAETDLELRARWRATVFRSLAGTEQMYLGVALADADCRRANVIGASKRHREQIQIVGGNATSVVDDVAYVYPDSAVLGPNIDGGVVMLRDHDYAFINSIPPTVHFLSPDYDTGDVQLDPITGIPLLDASGNALAVRAPAEGALLDLDFEYQPKASRNSPNSGITNRVDVWVAGRRAQAARQSVIFQSLKRFSSDNTDALYTGNFIRPDGTTPSSNNVFIPLAFGPLLSLPGSLVVGGTTYYGPGNSDPSYWIVHRDGATGWSPISEFGIEWHASRLPPSGAVFVVDTGYTFNEVPGSIMDAVNRWRLAGVDVQVHQATEMHLKMYFAVMYDRTANRAATKADLDSALAGLLAGNGFGATLQMSDILQTAHNIPGIDNIRLLTSADDAANYGIQQVIDGVVVANFNTNGRARDITFGDSEVPVFDSSVVSVRAQNTFHSEF